MTTLSFFGYSNSGYKALMKKIGA